MQACEQHTESQSENELKELSRSPSTEESGRLGGRRVRLPRNILVTILGLGAFLSFVTACERGPRSIAERRLSARLKTTFGISLPCSVMWCDSYSDGSMGGLIVDTGKDSLQWAWSPLVPWLGERARAANLHGARLDAWADSVLWHTPYPLLVGAAYYSAADARPIAIGSSAESSFIQLLWYVVGADSEFIDADRTHHKSPFAASVARCLQRQRAGLPAMRLHRGDP